MRGFAADEMYRMYKECISLLATQVFKDSDRNIFYNLLPSAWERSCASSICSMDSGGARLTSCP